MTLCCPLWSALPDYSHRGEESRGWREGGGGVKYPWDPESWIRDTGSCLTLCCSSSLLLLFLFLLVLSTSSSLAWCVCEWVKWGSLSLSSLTASHQRQTKTLKHKYTHTLTIIPVLAWWWIIHSVVCTITHTGIQRWPLQCAPSSLLWLHLL